MFKEPFERGPGENHEKTELTQKIDQLGLIRKKKASLEEQIKTPMIPSEGVKVLKEYKSTLELLNLIEADVTLIKEKEAVRLAKKFEKPTSANDSDFGATPKQEFWVEPANEGDFSKAVGDEYGGAINKMEKRGF